jgi:hypothetical protein
MIVCTVKKNSRAGHPERALLRSFLCSKLHHEKSSKYESRSSDDLPDVVLPKVGGEVGEVVPVHLLIMCRIIDEDQSKHQAETNGSQSQNTQTKPEKRRPSAFEHRLSHNSNCKDNER